MIVNEEKKRTRDPHLGLRYWVELGQIHIAGFRECTGLTIETEMFEYAEGGLNTYTHKLPVRRKYSNVTLKRGLEEGEDLFTWYSKNASGKIQRQNVSIIIYDPLGQPVRKWDLQNAYPCKWIGPELKAESGALAIETLEFAHEGLLPSSF